MCNTNNSNNNNIGLHWDNGKENGNYYNRVYIGVIIGYILIMRSSSFTTQD